MGQTGHGFICRNYKGFMCSSEDKKASKYININTN